MSTALGESANLNFANTVIQYLGEVFERAGFQLDHVGAQSVSFASEIASATVYYDPYSYEIGLSATWRAQPERSFSLSELLRFWKYPGAETYRNFAATDSDAMAIGVQKLRRLLEDLLSLGMQFDQDAYDGLLLQQQALSQKLASDVRLEQARKAASVAWQKKDYLRVVSVLSAVEKDLTQVERRQLEYAKKQLA